MNAKVTTPAWLPSLSPRQWSAIAAIALVLLGLQLWLFRPIIDGYFPTLDEIAVQAASTPIGGPINPLFWFTHGFQGYFNPYPEWSTGGNDFWRPLVNVYYWVSHYAFGEHWGEQLMVGYAAHAVMVGLVAYLALSVFRLGWWFAIPALAIATLNPAYVHPDALRDPLLIPRAIQYPIYQIEIVDALLVVIALLAFLRRRFALFALWATLAVLLKETAITAPLCALVMAGVWRSADRRQSMRNLAWLLVPLLVWLSGIGGMLLQHADSVYALPLAHPSSLLRQLPRRLLLWPTGLFQASLADARRAATGHDVRAMLGYAFELGVDLAWWAMLALAAVLIGRSHHRASGGTSPEPWLVGLVFAAGNLLLALLVLPPEVRFGYLWFALGPAALFCGLSRLRGGVALALALSAALVVPQVCSLAASLSSDSIAAFRLARGSARQLTGLLGSLPARVTTVYLLDDMADQTSSPAYFAKFSGFHGRLILVNNLQPVPGCKPTSELRRHYQLVSDGESGTLLRYQTPECFRSPFNDAPLQLFDRNNVVHRGTSLSYQYPDLSTLERRPNVPYELGSRFSLRANEPACHLVGACAWVGFDPVTRRYYVLPSAADATQ